MNREKLSAAGEIWRRFLYIVVEFIYGIKCKNLSKIAEMKIITINMRFYLIIIAKSKKLDIIKVQIKSLDEWR